MAEFYTSLTKREIACQISNLLNVYNKWYVYFSAQTIEMSPAIYFIEIVNDKVVGCASSLQVSNISTKIQHICVLPEYRKFGIASKLVEKIIDNCRIGHMFMTIREDNTGSIALAHKFGFICTEKHWSIDHWTLTFGRRN